MERQESLVKTDSEDYTAALEAWDSGSTPDREHPSSGHETVSITDTDSDQEDFEPAVFVPETPSPPSKPIMIPPRLSGPIRRARKVAPRRIDVRPDHVYPPCLTLQLAQHGIGNVLVVPPRLQYDQVQHVEGSSNFVNLDGDTVTYTRKSPTAYCTPQAVYLPSSGTYLTRVFAELSLQEGADKRERFATFERVRRKFLFTPLPHGCFRDESRSRSLSGVGKKRTRSSASTLPILHDRPTRRSGSRRPPHEWNTRQTELSLALGFDSPGSRPEVALHARLVVSPLGMAGILDPESSPASTPHPNAMVSEGLCGPVQNFDSDYHGGAASSPSSGDLAINPCVAISGESSVSQRRFFSCQSSIYYGF